MAEVKKFIGSDIDIAQAVYPEHALHVLDVAKKAGIPDKYIEQYGNYKAKIDYNYLNDHKNDKKTGNSSSLPQSRRRRRARGRRRRPSAFPMGWPSWAKRLW